MQAYMQKYIPIQRMYPRKSFLIQYLEHIYKLVRVSMYARVCMCMHVRAHPMHMYHNLLPT